MTATIHPFRKSSGGGPRARASGREARESFPATDQREVLRQTQKLIAESWSLRAESRAIKQRYEERRARIELLLAGMDGVERA